MAIVVGGVTTIQGDDNAVHRAKGHSHVERLDLEADGQDAVPPIRVFNIASDLRHSPSENGNHLKMVKHGGKPDTLKGVRPV